MHAPEKSNFPLSQIHLPFNNGKLPNLHNAHSVVFVASHLMHSLTESKHSLPVEILQEFFSEFKTKPSLHVVQVSIAEQILQFSKQLVHTSPLRKYPSTHAVHLSKLEHALQLSGQPLQTIPSRKLPVLHL